MQEVTNMAIDHKKRTSRMYLETDSYESASKAFKDFKGIDDMVEVFAIEEDYYNPGRWRNTPIVKRKK
jgi:hypothetical protein